MDKIENMDKWVTAKQAAELAGVHINTLARAGVRREIERKPAPIAGRGKPGFLYLTWSVAGWVKRRQIPTGFVRIGKAAKMLRISTMHVSRLCSRGDLEHERRLIGGTGPPRLLVKKDSIEQRIKSTEISNQILTKEGLT